MDSKIKDIGYRIREARKQQRLSQADLAEKAQVSITHISDIENGKTNIGIDIFMRLTEALQVSADWLLRTDIPQVSAIQSREISDILSDCTADETHAITKMVRDMKDALRKAKEQ